MFSVRNSRRFRVGLWLALAAFPIGLALPAAIGTGNRGPAEELVENFAEHRAEVSPRSLRTSRQLKTAAPKHTDVSPRKLASVASADAALPIVLRSEMSWHNGLGTWLRT